MTCGTPPTQHPGASEVLATGCGAEWEQTEWSLSALGEDAKVTTQAWAITSNTAEGLSGPSMAAWP